MSLPRYSEYKETNIDSLGKVPSHWHEAKFRHAFQESGERIESDVFGVMLSVSGYRGIEVKEYDDENRRRSDEDLIGYRIVRPGQLVVNTMWLNYAGLGVSDHEGHVSPAYRAYWISKDFHRRFVHHMMRSELFVRGYTKYLTGVRPNSLQMSREDLMQFRILKPPYEEQVAIAAFLDRETAKIDALIAEQERLLELLAEKRQAVISHAVTKGLNPDAAMKDSGVAWLGEVPAHWRVAPLGAITRERCDGPFGSGIKSSHYTDEGALVVRLQNIRSARFNVGEPVYLDADYFKSELRGHAVLAGDVLIAGLGDDNNLLGRACVAPPGLGLALVKADCFRFRLYEDMCPEFIAYQLSAGAAFDAGCLATGTTRSRIPLGVMAGRTVAFPPKEEQQVICERVDSWLAELDQLGREVERATLLLLERRSVLISSAVTGQIDVREAA